ncbi:MAG TPA: hypothetical protein VNZ26_19555 [Vicinamibacterales bacterium]|jgi:hypothetical protein|nr:hypothetical protein [Vicinamibacterales bacterium]
MAATELLHFLAGGSPKEVAQAIEDHARSLQGLQALVVPWESHGTTLSMAVTSVTGEGWAIEHKNLGTLRLEEVAAGRTQVTVSSALAGSSDASLPRQLLTLFDRFVAQLQSRFQLPG